MAWRASKGACLAFEVPPGLLVYRINAKSGCDAPLPPNTGVAVGAKWQRVPQAAQDAKGKAAKGLGAPSSFSI